MGTLKMLSKITLLVIPMSYPCYYTNLCPHKPHKHGHTQTHTHKKTVWESLRNWPCDVRKGQSMPVSRRLCSSVIMCCVCESNYMSVCMHLCVCADSKGMWTTEWQWCKTEELENSTLMAIKIREGETERVNIQYIQYSNPVQYL